MEGHLKSENDPRECHCALSFSLITSYALSTASSAVLFQQRLLTGHSPELKRGLIPPPDSWDVRINDSIVTSTKAA